MYRVVGPDGRETDLIPLDTLQAWVVRGQLPSHAVVILADGKRTTAGSMSELAGFYSMPPTPGSDALSSLIPTKNPNALLAYYFGYLTLVPWLGLFVAPLVFIWARKALVLNRENPAVKGRGHAITGIIFASIGLLINVGLWVIVVAALMNSV